MKITQIHYDTIKDQISSIWTSEKHESYRAHIIADGKAKDVEKRLRWDWSYRAKTTKWICENLYGYLDDSHIDTALKSIVRELEKQGNK